MIRDGKILADVKVCKKCKEKVLTPMFLEDEESFVPITEEYMCEHCEAGGHGTQRIDLTQFGAQ